MHYNVGQKVICIDDVFDWRGQTDMHPDLVAGQEYEIIKIEDMSGRYVDGAYKSETNSISLKDVRSYHRFRMGGMNDNHFSVGRFRHSTDISVFTDLLAVVKISELT